MTLMYGNKIKVWKKKREKLMINAGKVDNLRAIIIVRRSDRMRKERIRKPVGVCKELDAVINERMASGRGRVEWVGLGSCA